MNRIDKPIKQCDRCGDNLARTYYDMNEFPKKKICKHCYYLYQARYEDFKKDFMILNDEV